MIRSLLQSARDEVLRPEPMLRLYLKTRYGAKRPSELPRVNWENRTLTSRREWEAAGAEVSRLGLPPHVSPPKNWDSLAALHAILNSTTPAANVLDAGGAKYSQILPWLYLYGYRNLTCINLAFDRPAKWGPIRFEPGDITRTRFADATFHAITCLSVIEHGVDVRGFFSEMSRILKPDGTLVVSVDYYPEPIDTRNQWSLGVPIHIFTRDEAVAALTLAESLGLKSTSQVHLDCSEKTVRWPEAGLDFTYLTTTFKKDGLRQASDHGVFSEGQGS